MCFQCDIIYHLSFYNVFTGAGWYVEKVIVKEGDYESLKALDEKKETEKQKKDQKNKKAKKGKEEEKDEGPGYKMWYFPCDRWFDQGMEDGLIERVLEPGEPPIVEEVGPGELEIHWS